MMHPRDDYIRELLASRDGQLQNVRDYAILAGLSVLLFLIVTFLAFV